VGRQVLDASEETVFSLTVREAVTNIVRHAEATECLITLTTQDGFHSLVVADNGPKGVRREGNGLRGMRERVEAMKGRFRVTSGEGTRLSVELPAARVEAETPVVERAPAMLTRQGA
jgi:two-component system sensor histidine kinase DesK